jgi:hypothetical protein
MPPTDRSAPGVRLTLFQDEKTSVGVPLDLGLRLLSFAFDVRVTSEERKK